MTLTGALVPQILMNLRNKSAGEWSVASAAMSTAGNAVKVFTTVQLAGSDPVLLAGFFFGLATNAILLSQIIYYQRAASAAAENL